MSSSSYESDSGNPYSSDSSSNPPQSTTPSSTMASSSSTSARDGENPTVYREDYKPNVILRASMAIDSFVRAVFIALAKHLAARPWLFIIGSLVFTVLCGLGFMNLTPENRAEKLWIPDNSPAIGQQKFVQDNFASGFRIENFIATTNPAGGNILTKNSIQQLMAFHTEIATLSTEADGSTWNLDKLCFKTYTGGPCVVTGLLEFWQYNPTAVAAIVDDADVINRINTPTKGSFGSTIDLSSILGGVTRDGANRVISAEATRSTYFVTRDNERVVDGEDVDPPAENWEEAFLKLEATGSITTIMSAERSIPDAFSEAISGDITLLSAGIMLIVLYSVIMLGKYDWVYSRAAVALAGVGSILLAVITSYGLASAMGIIFSPVQSVLPFVLLGIGVDDMFIIVAALDHQDRRAPLKDRIVGTLAEAGTAITVTSLTDMVAFLVGSSTSLPALRSFALFAALGILFDFIYQITFFSGFLVLDARRQDAGRMDCFCCRKIEGRDQETLRQQPEKLEEKPTGIRLFFSRILPDKFAPFVSSPLGAGIILVIFVICVGLGIYGSTQMKQSFKFSSFVPDDDPYQDYLKAQDKYFGEVPYPVDVYIPDIAYHTADAQTRMTAMAVAVQGQSDIIANSVTSWFEEYKVYAAASGIDLTSQTAFYTGLASFFASPQGQSFSSDVRWVDDTTKTAVKASRIGAVYRSLQTSTDQVNAMDGLRDTVNSVGIDGAFPFTFEYLFWEQYSVITKEAGQNLGLACLCVLIITTALLGHPGAALLVTLAVGFTILNLFGFSYFWNLDIDSVVVINAVIAIGLSVDYAAHVTHAFLARDGSPRDRTVESLASVGGPVLNGAFSTFIAVLVLAFSKSFVFRIFFKMFFLVIVFGLFHGLCVIPVLNRWINWQTTGTLTPPGTASPGEAATELKIAKSIKVRDTTDSSA